MAVLEKDSNNQVQDLVNKSIVYLSQEDKRNRHMVGEDSTFYFNWQAQLLCAWIKIKKTSNFSLEKEHLVGLLEALQKTSIAQMSFDHLVATVEVACYLEGLSHANYVRKILKMNSDSLDKWMLREIDRSLEFLYDVQNSSFKYFHGGFPHSKAAGEARVDVTGHVFNGLSFLYSNP